MAGRNPGRGREAGYKAVNARTLWDAGVVYGDGTDRGYLPWEGLKHELRTLNLMFSPEDIVKVMGPNTAAFIKMSDDLGTLEVGKLADIVLLDGSPLEGYWNLLNIKMTIKEGEFWSTSADGMPASYSNSHSNEDCRVQSVQSMLPGTSRRLLGPRPGRKYLDGQQALRRPDPNAALPAASASCLRCSACLA